MNTKLALLILTYNEEKNIAACIQSAPAVDEIIVIDSGSTDQTAEMATQLGAKVVVRPMDKTGFAGQRNFALEQTTADWVLYLDADERATPALMEEIRQVVKENGDGYAYEILRVNVVFGQVIRHGGHSPDYSLRFYPRTAIHWEGNVHEQAQVQLPIRQLKQSMLHHTYTNWERYFFKFNQYTTLMAEQMHSRGKKASFFDIAFRPWMGFIKFYVLKAGWRDGKMGFILAVFHIFYTMAKYVKLYYLQNDQTEGQ